MRARQACRGIAIATGVAFAASCGRFGFDARTGDGGSGSIDAPAIPALVAMTALSTGDAAAFPSFEVPIPTVTAGNLLVVAVADHRGNIVASVTDGAGRPLISANARAKAAITSELWYETDSIPTTAITVTMSPASAFDVWVGEFSGTTGAPATVAKNCLAYPPTIVTAPALTTVANELVFSVTMLEFPLYVSQVLPPFIGAEPLTGNSASYYVATVPGTYSTSFDIASGSGMAADTCASTATWLPAP